MKQQITNEQWQALYDRAIQIKKNKPWDVLNVGHVFAVEDPQTKINYYCSMQSNEDMDSISVFIGEEGFSRFMMAMAAVEEAVINEQELTLGVYMAPFDEASLHCDFVSRDQLSPEEYKQIKSLGLNFRGKKQWITFQKNSPGMITSALLDPEDVRVLSLILERILETPQIQREFGLIGDLLDEVSEIYDIFWWRHDDQRKEWVTGFRTLEGIYNSMVYYDYGNELYAKKMLKLKYQKQSYELIRLYIPTPVVQDGEAYYPVVIMLLDLDQGIIVWDYIDAVADAGYSKRALDNLSQYFIQLGAKPRGIMTADTVAYSLLLNYCQDSKISLEFLEESIAGDDILHDFLEYHLRQHIKALDDMILNGLSEEEIQGLIKVNNEQEKRSIRDSLAPKDKTTKLQPPVSNLIDMRTRKPIHPNTTE